MAGAGTALPTFTALITPDFDDIQKVSFSISITLNSPGLQPGDLIVIAPIGYKNTTEVDCTANYEDCQVTDGQGPLSVEWGPYEKTWALFISPEPGYTGFTPRASLGDVNIRYRMNLNAEQGGYLGPGRSFLLNPPLAGSSPCRKTLPPPKYCNIVSWDISNAPAGTRAVSTFGEGPEPREIIGDAEALRNAVYMVGPVQSYPPATESNSVSDEYGYYWFGNLPPNIEAIKDIHYGFSQKVAGFFSDPLSPAKSYRTFIQNVTPAKGFGNISFPRSNIFCYDNRISSAQDYDLVRCMAHEMTYNFISPIPKSPNQIESWFYEGISNALSIYFPFRPPLQFRDGKYFQATLNMLAMKYYTSPLINLSLDELLEQAQANDYAQEQLSARAWAFVVSTDFRARDLAGQRVGGVQQRPIEDRAIKVMAKKRQNGEPYGLQQWFELLEPLMGEEAVGMFEKMKKGEVFIFPEKAFGAKTHRIVEKPQEILDFGMERESFEKGVVMGLKEGSRAQKAGLREGDKIVEYSYPWRCVDDFDAKMEVFVQRVGETEPTRVEYWPRSFKAASCWQLKKLEDE